MTIHTSTKTNGKNVVVLAGEMIDLLYVIFCLAIKTQSYSLVIKVLQLKIHIFEVTIR